MAEPKNAVEAQRGLRYYSGKFLELNGSSIFLALVVLCVFCQFLGPIINPAATGTFINLTNIINVFRQYAYLGVVACGMTFVIVTANIDLSVGSQLTLLAVLCAQMTWYSPALAIVGTILVGALLGAVNGAFVAGLKLNSFIVTLGTSSIYASLAILANANGGARDQNSQIFNNISTGTIFGIIPGPVIILAGVVLVFWFVMRHTVYGQRLYVIGSNSVAARFSGIRSRLSIFLAYVLTGACCGLGGVIMIARTVSANPQAASGQELNVIMAVVLGGTSVIGGKGSIWGTVIGIMFIGFLSMGFTYLGISTYMQWIVQGIILVIALAFDARKGRGG